jgi:2'-hydroxyisoflavone reductase
MKLLILGGTRFLGRYLVHSALARGHQITLFNRGQSNPDLFPEVEKLRGDRLGDLHVLKGRQWDAVIDTCGYASAQVRAAADALATSVEHYTFISSISAYADFSQAGLNENAPLAALPHGAVEDENNPETYGARKTLCERAAEQSMPGRVLNIRPGIIIGLHDPTDRFTWWVRRIAKGEETLAPERPDNPMQLIDVRDLASWIVQMVEKTQVGAYNATGPEHPLTFQRMLEACQLASGSNSRFTWVDAQFLLEKGVVPFRDLPLWMPASEKEYAGHFLVDSRRAFRSGLVCRPLTETARDILLWDRNRSLPQESPKGSAPKQIGLAPHQEQELLSAWKNSSR